MRFVILLLLACTTPAAVSFRSHIAPILLEKCVGCHGPEKAKGGYRLDTFELIQKPGDSKKPPVVAGQPQASHLFALLTTPDKDDRMPQKSDALPSAQIALINQWIKEGAVFDGSSPTASLSELVPFQPGPEPLARYPSPQPVLALAWSIDGKSIATSGYHEALVWSDAGNLRHRVSRLPQRIHGLAFVNTDQLAIASGTPGKLGAVLLCRAGSDETPRLLARLPDVAVSLAVNPQRTLLAAGGSDNSIRLFELPSGKELHVIQQHSDWVTALAFSSDGAKLASASRDRTARVLDPIKGLLLENYAEHAQPLFAVAFSSDGKRVFSGGREKKAHAWQIQDARKAGEFPALAGDVLALASADNRLYAAGGDTNIHEFNPDDRKQTRVLSGHRDWVYSLAWHPDSKRLASGSYDGEVRVWRDGQSVITFKVAP